jgi:hypothetical protein
LNVCRFFFPEYSLLRLAAAVGLRFGCSTPSMMKVNAGYAWRSLARKRLSARQLHILPEN